MSRVSRFLEYRRALWFSNELNLENHLHLAWSSLPNNTDRIFGRSDGASVMGMRLKDCGRLGVAIHCAKYVEQQGVGIVGMTDASLANLSERAPRNSENFLNSDFMAIVNEDHVITLNAGQNAASLRSYLQGLFRLAKHHDDTGKFDLVRIADVGQLKRIQAIGVGSIGLKVSIDEATASTIAEDFSTRTMWDSLTKPINDIIVGLIGRDDKTSQIANSKKGMLNVSINVPKNDLEAARSGLDGIAEALVEDDEAEQFVINLRNGESIKPGEIAVKKRVRLERFSNTVNRNDVWEEMETYMSELKDSGYLET